MKTTLKFFGWLALLYLGLLGVCNVVIHKSASTFFRRQTGFDVTFEHIHVGVIRPSIEITGLTLFNPADFEEREALFIRRAYIRYSPSLLFKREIHLREVVLDMPKLVVVKKADGEYNLGRLGKAVASKDEKPKGEAKPKPAPAPGEAPPPRPLRIDTLTFKLGTAQMITHRRVGAPRTRSIEMNIEKTFTDVTDLNAVAKKLTLDIVANEAEEIVVNVAEKLKKGGDVEKLDKAAKKLGERLNGMFKKTKREE